MENPLKVPGTDYQHQITQQLGNRHTELIEEDREALGGHQLCPLRLYIMSI